MRPVVVGHARSATDRAAKRGNSPACCRPHKRHRYVRAPKMGYGPPCGALAKTSTKEAASPRTPHGLTRSSQQLPGRPCHPASSYPKTSPARGANTLFAEAVGCFAPRGECSCHHPNWSTNNTVGAPQSRVERRGSWNCLGRTVLLPGSGRPDSRARGARQTAPAGGCGRGQCRYTGLPGRAGGLAGAGHAGDGVKATSLQIPTPPDINRHASVELQSAQHGFAIGSRVEGIPEYSRICAFSNRRQPSLAVMYNRIERHGTKVLSSQCAPTHRQLRVEFLAGFKEI